MMRMETWKCKSEKSKMKEQEKRQISQEDGEGQWNRRGKKKRVRSNCLKKCG